MVVAAAMAASTALPPRFRIATPAWDASACGVATTPRVDRHSAQRVAALTRPMILGHIFDEDRGGRHRFRHDRCRLEKRGRLSMSIYRVLSATGLDEASRAAGSRRAG